MHFVSKVCNFCSFSLQTEKTLHLQDENNTQFLLSTSVLQNKHPKCDMNWKPCVHWQCHHSCQEARGCRWGVAVLGHGQGQEDEVVGYMMSLQSSSALEVWLRRIIIWLCLKMQSPIWFPFSPQDGWVPVLAPLGYHIQPISGSDWLSHKHWLKLWKWLLD